MLCFKDDQSELMNSFLMLLVAAGTVFEWQSSNVKASLRKAIQFYFTFVFGNSFSLLVFSNHSNHQKFFLIQLKLNDLVKYD